MGRVKSPGPEGIEGITKAEVNDLECPMVIDTGATMTAVPGRLIAPSQYTGCQVNVSLEDGSSTKLKEAMVNVLANGKTKPLRVIVLQDDALEGLLGKDHPKTHSLLQSDQTQAVKSVPVQVRAITRAQHRAQIKERSEDREADACESTQPKSSSEIEVTSISTQAVTSQADDVIVGSSPNTSPQPG